MTQGKLFKLGMAWLLALGATLGSLYFGEVEKFPPCWLCWMQRVFLFPLPILLGIALYKNDEAGVRYALPLAIVGLLFSLYHNLSFYFPELENFSPCSEFARCSETTVWITGWLTLPLLSLACFFLLVLLLI